MDDSLYHNVVKSLKMVASAVQKPLNAAPAEPVEGAEVRVVSGAAESFEGAELELLCHLSAGTHVSYSWLLNGRPVSGSLYGRERLLVSR